MWPDNETDVDLLGFDFLVDELLVLLHDPSLLPVTIGLAGDWGSGKSSILKMTAAKLAEEGDGFIVVPFSPWRYEDYEDVKTSLIQDVLSEMAKHLPDEGAGDRRAKAKRLLKRLALRVKVLPILKAGAAALLAGHTSLPPEAVALAAGGAFITSDLEARQENLLEESAEPPPGTPDDQPVSLAEFRETFGELVETVGAHAVVVFVDDLDRCLPDTVLDVFEAVRLFLNAERTAFVIAADQRVVQAAVEHSYKDMLDRNPKIGTDYLEKILQVTISVPPLSQPETVSYINLLLAHSVVGEPDFAKLREAARAARELPTLGVSMNHGIALKALGAVPPELAQAFEIADRITPALASKHKGNPRQIKRFLNLLELRQSVARRRNAELDPAVLAKLMVLETVAIGAYHRLFEWQAAAGGKAPQVEDAEKFARADQDRAPAPEVDEAVAEWLADAAVADWCRSEPALTGIDLAPYFFYSRDRFTPALPAMRLRPELLAVEASLRSSSDATRGEALDAAVKLAAEDLTDLYDALLVDVTHAPRDKAMRSAIELAKRVPDPLVGRLAQALGTIPPTGLSAALPAMLKASFPDLSPFNAVLDSWERAGGTIARAVADIRKNRGA